MIFHGDSPPRSTPINGEVVFPTERRPAAAAGGAPKDLIQQLPFLAQLVDLRPKPGICGISTGNPIAGWMVIGKSQL